LSFHEKKNFFIRNLIGVDLPKIKKLAESSP